MLFSLALIWLASALGLAAKSVETAMNTPMFLTLLPLLGSGFVVLATLPTGLEQFARHQPFTLVTETLRGLLTGTPIGNNGIMAVAWSVGIALVSYLWADTSTRRSARPDRPLAWPAHRLGVGRGDAAAASHGRGRAGATPASPSTPTSPRAPSRFRSLPIWGPAPILGGLKEDLAAHRHHTGRLRNVATLRCAAFGNDP